MKPLAQAALGLAMGGALRFRPFHGAAQCGGPGCRRLPDIEPQKEHVSGQHRYSHTGPCGDLRLECKVAIAIGKKEAPFWLVAAANTVLLTGDWCSKVKGDGNGLDYLAPAELAGATLVQSERRIALKTEKRQHRVPIGEASWADEALVELRYAGGEQASR